MRPMTLLASVFFTSLAMATFQVACSSGNSSSSSLTPFDSGVPNVPEASAATPGPVTVTVVGKGYIVSSDGVPVTTGGVNGFAGVDGGAPVVDCPSSCASV